MLRQGALKGACARTRTAHTHTHTHTHTHAHAHTQENRVYLCVSHGLPNGNTHGDLFDLVAASQEDVGHLSHHDIQD